MDEKVEHAGQLKVRARLFASKFKALCWRKSPAPQTANLLSVIQIGYIPSAKSKHAQNGNKHLLKHTTKLHFQCHLL